MHNYLKVGTIIYPPNKDTVELSTYLEAITYKEVKEKNT